VLEMALAHTVGDKVEAAYRRGDLFENRRRLAADWAKHCTTRARADKVTPIRRMAIRRMANPPDGELTDVSHNDTVTQ
jgi:hypothetical protein